MSCPLLAHPRQMDFSFMLLPPLPPAIFPSLPLRHSPTPLILAVTFTIRFQPPSSAVCLFHIFVIIVVKSPHQVLLIGGWAPSHSPPVVILLFAHLPCLPLHFLLHQIGTQLSVDCCFSIAGCRHHHHGVSLLAASLMGWALHHSVFPSLSSPPTQTSSACLPISWHVLPLGAGFPA
jgi:hypothetical protein